MTLVKLTGEETALGGPVAVDDGHVLVEYRAGSRDYVEVDGETVVLPRDILVPIVNGAPVTPLVLEPTRGVCCVRFTVRSGAPKLVRYVAIPDVPEVDFGDLVDVDPDSYAPVDLTPTLVETIDARLIEQIGPALDEYMAENPLQGATTEYVDTAIAAHVNDPTPHPAYDEDIPSLALIFENGLV